MTHVDIVFQERPNPREVCRGGGEPEYIFVEVEDSTGKSRNFGAWVNRADGYSVLRITKEQFEEMFRAP